MGNKFAIRTPSGVNCNVYITSRIVEATWMMFAQWAFKRVSRLVAQIRGCHFLPRLVFPPPAERYGVFAQIFSLNWCGAAFRESSVPSGMSPGLILVSLPEFMNFKLLGRPFQW